MTDETIDIHKAKKYFARGMAKQMLLFAFIAFVVGVLGAATYSSGTSKHTSSVLFLIGGLIGCGWAIFASFDEGNPTLVLSPEGILLRIKWAKDIRIPWDEIKDVATIDIKTWALSYGSIIPIKVKFPEVTVVRVSSRFYDDHIHVDSSFTRGPGWKRTFLPKGSSVLVAFHHLLLDVPPRPLKREIIARWHAFRDGEKPQADEKPA